MRERRDCTPDRSGAPAVKGEWVGIFVPDAHPLLRLKGAVDWEGITAVMVKKWREANKNVDGGRGLAWPVHLYVPLLLKTWMTSSESWVLQALRFSGRLMVIDSLMWVAVSSSSMACAGTVPPRR